MQKLRYASFAPHSLVVRPRRLVRMERPGTTIYPPLRNRQVPLLLLNTNRELVRLALQAAPGGDVA